MTITSGYRGEALDLSLSTSNPRRTGQHFEGRAADFHIAGVTAQQLLNFAISLRFSTPGVGRQFGYSYNLNNQVIHIDTRGR